jgi:uncharacterized protein YerC
MVPTFIILHLTRKNKKQIRNQISKSKQKLCRCKLNHFFQRVLSLFSLRFCNKFFDDVAIDIRYFQKLLQELQRERIVELENETKQELQIKMPKFN